MSIKQIAKKINELFPLDVAQKDWDNVGILIDTGSHSKTLMLTIDITDDVIKECVDYDIKNIVAYHPIIFRPVKNIQSDDLIAKLFKNQINVFCPHTSWDPTLNKYIYKLFNNGEFKGNSGRNNKKIHEVLYALKHEVGASYIRVGFSKKHWMGSVLPTMVVGAGAAFKYHDYKNSLIITGEMDHHVILHTVRNNNTVILLEHSDSERIALGYFWEVLTKALPDYKIEISEDDHDPIKIF